MAPRFATRVAGGLPAPTGATPDSSSESRMELLARGGRRTRLYIGAVVLVALLATLVVLITKNTRSVKLDWAFGSAQASLVWIILAAAVGWLLGITTAVVFQHRTRRP